MRHESNQWPDKSMVTNDDYNDDPSRWLPKPNHDESEMATTTITTTTTMTTATLTTSKTTKCFSFSFSFWLSVRLIVSWWWLIHGQGGYCVSAAVQRYHLRLFWVYTGLSNNTIVNGFTSFGLVWFAFKWMMMMMVSIVTVMTTMDYHWWLNCQNCSIQYYGLSSFNDYEDNYFSSCLFWLHIQWILSIDAFCLCFVL